MGTRMIFMYDNEATNVRKFKYTPYGKLFNETHGLVF